MSYRTVRWKSFCSPEVFEALRGALFSKDYVLSPIRTSARIARWNSLRSVDSLDEFGDEVSGSRESNSDHRLAVRGGRSRSIVATRSLGIGRTVSTGRCSTKNWLDYAETPACAI